MNKIFIKIHYLGNRSLLNQIGVMKSFVIATAILLMFGGRCPASAQLIFGLHTRSNNVYICDLMAIGELLVDAAIANATDGALLTDYSFGNVHYVEMEDNGESIDNGITPLDCYKFTSYHLFNDIEAGLKFGWLGPESPIGGFVYAAYGINQYKLRFLGERDYSKHKLQSFRAGIGVRISPLKFLLDDYGWCPLVELGTTYIKNFSYKGPNGCDINQINDGMRSSYAIGVQFGDDGEGAIMLCMDMAHYDIFNRNYTPDGGFWYPYANFKSKDLNISLRLSINLCDD